MATLPVTVTVTDKNGQQAQSVGGTVTPGGGTAPVNAGETNILSSGDNSNGNLLLAQPASLTQTGILQSLSFYVSATGGQLRLGVYSDLSGKPGILLAQTNAFTPKAGWNTQPTTTMPAIPAGQVWLAYLPQSNSLGFQKVDAGGTRSVLKAFTFGPMPATFPSGANSTASHWSFYGTFLEGSVPTIWVNSVAPGGIIPPGGGGGGVTAGWTTFTPSSDTQIAYISATGNDGTAVVGTLGNSWSTAHPFATLAAARSAVGWVSGAGVPNWILIRKGDTFGSTMTPGEMSGMNGRSSSEPFVFGSYYPTFPGVVDPVCGQARPIFNCTTITPIRNYNGSIDNLAVVGLDFNYVSDTTGDRAGYSMRSSMSWFLMEDCRYTGFGNEASHITTYKPRRCQFLDMPTACYSEFLGTFGTTSGYFGYQNFYDQNGLSSLNSQNRNLYLQINCGSATSNEEIFTRSESSGIQWRGGTICDNIIVYNNGDADGMEIGHPFGDSNGGGSVLDGLTNITAGVFIHNAGGAGIAPLQMLNSRITGCVINGVAGDVGNGNFGIGMDFYNYVANPNTPCSGNTFTGNAFYNFGSNSSINGGVGHWLSSESIVGDYPAATNTITPNTQDIVPVGGVFPDPTRDPITYWTNVVGGAGGQAGWYTQMRGMNKENWNSQLEAKQVNNWIRTGFGL